MASSRWDIGNWKSGKISVPEAFGLTKGKWNYPKLRATLPGKVAQSENAGTGASGGNKGDPTGKSELTNQALGKKLAAAPPYNWTGKQWTALNNIAMAESGWSTTAKNPSGAYGIPQALPGSKMASAGPDYKTDANTQIKWMLSYIQSRYGTPEKAWQFHLANGWY